MFSIVKFLSGFNLFNGEKLAKLVFYFILIAVGLGIYHKAFIMPTQKNYIEKQIIVQKDKDFVFLGVKVWKIKLGATIE